MKLYQTISEVSKELRCAQSKLRYYEDFYELKIKRVSRGVRRYKLADVQLLKSLLQMERLGLSMKLIKRVVDDEVACELVRMLTARLK